MLKKMNLPNKLTLLRLVLVPIFMIFEFPIPGGFLSKVGPYIGLVIYVAASITDLMDGKIARKRGLITDFGKFLDPIADKLLVTAGLLALTVNYSRYYAWAAMIILAREFLVSAVRMYAASKGTVVAAGRLGKLKMVFQTDSIIILLLGYIIVTWPGMVWYVIGKIHIYLGVAFLVAALALTIISGIQYAKANLHFSEDDI